MATIMTVHMTRNIAACAQPATAAPMLIHAIDIDQPPGIGIADDMELRAGDRVDPREKRGDCGKDN